MDLVVDDAHMTRGELKIKMYETLRKQGVVDSIKAQLRNRLLEDLKKKGKGGDLRRESPEKLTLELRVLNTLVARHLSESQYLYTKEVFLPVSLLSARHTPSDPPPTHTNSTS